ncbi:MAG TPA: sigma 54-interacting transcriptional regulator [Candidatus Limnocylindrales bacterium]|nr:sigma 54-interacting transcriptional regulator [Candidatus Limnocylindrales bacterium]
MAESIARHRQLATLFGELSRCLKPLVHFDFIGLTLVDFERGVVRLHVLETDQPLNGALTIESPLGETPTSETLKTREPFYSADIMVDERYPRLRDVAGRHGIHSFCSLPLSTAQRDLGGLNFGSMEASAYSAEDVEFMRHVARQVAVAVDNALNSESAREYETQLARERDRLRALLEINNAVVGCLASKSLFQAISASLRRSFGLDYVSLLIYDAESGAMRLQVLDFPEGSGAIQEDAVVPLHSSLAGFVFQQREGRVFNRQEVREISPGTADLFEREDIRSICCIPLLAPSGNLGSLNLGSRREDFFAADDVPFFTQVAGQISIALQNALSYKRVEELNARLEEEKVYLEGEIRTDNRFEDIVGDSRALKAILEQVATVAPTDATVLIYGETGTGKELIARAIHELSGRKQGTFVKLNCAAIPTGLLESEMFGHEKGAFTGAIAQRIGRFELANHGSIFLDEVGEIPLELQTKLLRVLQEREFERLGSSRTLKTDARLIAATNRDLGTLVEAREFRADLYYRLNVFPVTVPALRERREDIPLLVRYFVQQSARRMNKRIGNIPSEAMEAMTRYDWPGNIRELQNFVERAVILTPGASLQAPVQELRKAGPVSAPAAGGPAVTLEDAEREAILKALREAGGKVGGERGAAALLGMKRTTLQAKMRKLGIEAK